MSHIDFQIMADINDLTWHAKCRDIAVLFRSIRSGKLFKLHLQQVLYLFDITTNSVKSGLPKTKVVRAGKAMEIQNLCSMTVIQKKEH